MALRATSTPRVLKIRTLAGLLTFEGWVRGLLPALVYLSLHGLESNFVTPMILGLALIESLVIYSLIISILLLGKIH